MRRNNCVVTRITCLEGTSETNLESHVDLLIKTRQGRATTLGRQLIFPMENELPQAGLEPATHCILCRCSAN